MVLLGDLGLPTCSPQMKQAVACVPKPLKGAGHRTMGFYVWPGNNTISDISVRDL